MTLGQNIARLRGEKHLSQGELADALDVSRQSISKWETNASVPELDKLIQLSEVFHISLDELVKGDIPPAHTVLEDTEPTYTTPPQPAPVIVQKTTNTRKIVGIILLCFGALVLLLLTLLGGYMAGLLFSSPFILCGIVCLVFKQNAGLWCAWALLFAVNIYLRYATGVSWHLTRLTAIFEPSMNYLRLAFAWFELICYMTFVAVTVLRFRKKPLEPTKKTYTLLAVGCFALALTYIPVTMDTLGPLSTVTRLYFIFSDWVRIALITTILSAAARLYYSRKKEAPQE